MGCSQIRVLNSEHLFINKDEPHNQQDKAGSPQSSTVGQKVRTRRCRGNLLTYYKILHLEHEREERFYRKVKNVDVLIEYLVLLTITKST